MNTRLAFFALGAAVGFAFIGQANMYNDWAQKNAVNLNGPSAIEAAQSPTAPILQRIKQESQSCKDEWSGSLDDLKALVDRAKQKYGSENTKHMGRNATMIVPANLNEMRRLIDRGDKSIGDWSGKHPYALADGYHANNAKQDDNDVDAVINAFGSGVAKYVVTEGEFKGAEVVYDKDTGNIVKDWRMGTRNYSFVADGVDHDEADVDTHKKIPEYKYVGILVETDPTDPNKYFIVNGQTGKRMTWREAEDFPTTLSDEWKNMGLACVADDAKDVIAPNQCRDEAKCSIDTPKQDMQSDKTEKSASASELKTASNRVDVANPTPLAAADSGVGVRGWCKCGAEHGKIYTVGGGGQWISLSTLKLSMIGDYRYELCGRCGMLFKPERAGEAAKIVDLRIERKYKQFAGSRIPSYKYKSLLKQAENKLLDIPDGKIVIRGTCVCKVPDPVHVGFLENDYSPYVCIICGRVCLPDETGGISNGPTALSEMGLDKQAEEAMKRMCKWIEGL